MQQFAATTPNSNVIAMPPAQSEQQRSMFDMQGCTFTATGLIIEPGMPIDDWVELGKRLGKAGDSLGIWRGDWINYGKHEYRKKYESALALTGLKEGTLRNDVWISNAVPLSYRNDKLTSKHYSTVASLPTKGKIKKWLERALQGDGKRIWSAARLRKEIGRAASAAPRSDLQNSTHPPTAKTEPVLSKQARAFLDDYMSALARLSEEIPAGLSDTERETLRTMIHEHGAEALWLRGRTCETDCQTIVKVMKDTEAASHTGEMAVDDLYRWMVDLGYFIPESEYQDRLEYMNREDVRMALLTDAGKDGKQEDRRGKLPGIVCVPWRKVWNQSAKRERDEDDD